jgi:3-phosphoshikimate 1-carboxyvinyltransferase
MSQSKLLVRPQRVPLHGTISVPADKSISHRAIMLAAIADGHSIIRNWLPAGDTIVTLEAMKALGVDVRVERRAAQAWELRIEGKGLRGLEPPARPLDCGNAGTCMRLLAGILVGQSFPSILDGSEQLRKRPMSRIVDPLQKMGAKITSDDTHAPLRIGSSALHGTTHTMKVASAQVKSAILLAALYAAGKTRVSQPGPARDHTERMLAAMGANVAVDGYLVVLSPGLALSPLDLSVPGDISSAAFLLVAAAIVAHSRLTVTDVGSNGTRTGILDMMTDLGAHLSLANEHVNGGEPAVDLSASFDELHGAKVGGTLVVRGIDEFPIWAVAATQADGESTVRDAAELRVKEVDRISILACELGRMGARIVEHSDGFTVSGPTRLRGAEVDSHGDHRMGMALAIAGLVAQNETLIHNAGCISDSFPGFVETMRRLGADMEWVT